MAMRNIQEILAKNVWLKKKAMLQKKDKILKESRNGKIKKPE